MTRKTGAVALAGVVGLLALLTVSPSVAEGLCNQDTLAINRIQGTGKRSPFEGERVSVAGLVTATYQSQDSLKGFFMLSESHQQDLDPRTSEGLFIYSTLPVSTGQRVVVQGTVTEYYGLTELSKVTAIERCSDSNPLPRPWPLPAGFESDLTAEAFESMPVITPPLWVTDNYDLTRFGELQLASADHFTALSVGEKLATGSSRWIIDDAAPGQRALWHRYIDAEGVRLGTQIAPFEALVSFGFGQFRLLPQSRLSSRAPELPPARVDNPFQPNQSTSIAQLNVRNFFNGDGQGMGFPTLRGAKTWEEFAQQRDKLALTITQLNADFVALSEVENDGFGKHSALSDLTRAINALQPDALPYHYVKASGNPGNDQIIQALLYRETGWQLLDSDFLPLSDPMHTTRPALWTRWVQGQSKRSLDIAIVHLKSRRQGCNEDTKEEPAEGYCHRRREAMAEHLVTLLPSDADLSLLTGDFNAYTGERPLTLLTDAGWLNTRSLQSGGAGYTYVYKAQPVALDHFLIRTAAARLPRLFHLDWHINAPESDIRLPLERQNQQTTVFRSSDHDPSILFLEWR